MRALACASLALLLAAGAAAESNPTEVIRKALHERYPDVRVVDIKPAPLPGIYEVFTGNQLVYSDASGDHLFVGKLLDTRTRNDLAATELDRRLAIDFQRLPFERAIKIVKGSGARRLALFEDPDCPFCLRLEKSLANIDNVTLYVFLFPLSELHPQAREHAHAIWCAADRADAWMHWMLERKTPATAACGADPIDELQRLGEQLYVTATPTLFFANGRRLEGDLPAAKLEELLESPPASPVRADAAGAGS